MDLSQYLIMLGNTLENIEVHGKANLERLLGCINQTELMQKRILGGETDGRQSDIGADTSNVSNTK